MASILSLGLWEVKVATYNPPGLQKPLWEGVVAEWCKINHPRGGGFFLKFLQGGWWVHVHTVLCIFTTLANPAWDVQLKRSLTLTFSSPRAAAVYLALHSWGTYAKWTLSTHIRTNSLTFIHTIHPYTLIHTHTHLYTHTHNTYTHRKQRFSLPRAHSGRYFAMIVSKRQVITGRSMHCCANVRMKSLE